MTEPQLVAGTGLLAFFLVEQGRALTRKRILDEVWGCDVIVEDGTVNNFVTCPQPIGLPSGRRSLHSSLNSLAL